jgi:hypothetical protein
VLDRVADEVAQHPLHPPRVDLGHDVLVGPVHHQLALVSLGECVHPGHHAGDQRTQVGGIGGEHRGPGVVPADLQEVAEQRLEPVELGPQQFRRSGHVRREVAPRLVQHLGRHLHGGQGRAQLVRDVGGEPLLQLGQPLQLGDLPLQAVGHGVEAGGQPRQVVLAAHAHPLLQLPLGQLLRGTGGPADRIDHQSGHQHPDADHEEREGDTADDHRAADQRQALLLLEQGEEVVELDPLGARRVAGHRRADQQRPLGVPLLVGHRPVLVGLVARIDVGPQVRRNGAEDVAPAVGGPLDVAGAVDHDDVELAGLAPAGEQLLHRAVQGRAHARRVAGRDTGHLRLRVEHPALRLVDRRLPLHRQQLVADLAEQHQADDDDDGAGHDHRDRADADLQGRPPGVHAPGPDPAREHAQATPNPLRPAAQAAPDPVQLGRRPRPARRSGRRRNVGLDVDAPRGQLRAGHGRSALLTVPITVSDGSLPRPAPLLAGSSLRCSRPCPLTAGRPCSPPHARSARSPASPDRARSSRAVAARGR